MHGNYSWPKMYQLKCRQKDITQLLDPSLTDQVAEMADWETRLNASGIIFLALAVYCGSPFLLNEVSIWPAIKAILLGIPSALAFHAASLKPAPTLTLKALLVTYALHGFLTPILSLFSHRQTISLMKNPQKVQDDVLLKILSENGRTAFGKDYKLEEIKSRKDFQKIIPLTKYDTYEKYADRIAHGEENVMTKAKVIALATSSGTTGKNKLYPLTNADFPLLVHFGLSYFHSLGKVYNNRLHRIFDFRMYHPEKKTSCGLKISGVAAIRQDLRPNMTNPLAISKIGKEGPSYFVQAVFSLRDPFVGSIIGTSSDLLFAFFKSIEFNKDAICKAIANGRIDSFPGLDDEVQQELNTLLTPDPERAEMLQREIEKGPDNFAKRIWPDIEIVIVGRTGAYAHSAKLLLASYLKNLKMFFGVHVSTEGMIGASMSPTDLFNEEYTFLIRNLFLEFIKLGDMDEAQPKTYLLSELEVGQMYEVVITNWYGLYRNRFGDVIKVVGYTEKTPKYTFQYRTGQILNCAYDRTPEKVFYDALKLAESEWQVEVQNYSSSESMHLEAVNGQKSRKNHYIAIIETKDDVKLNESHSSVLDQKLRDLQQTYGEYRDQDSLGPVEIVQVAPGTFDKLRGVLWGDRPNLQYKTPRVLRSHKALEHFWNNRV